MLEELSLEGQQRLLHQLARCTGYTLKSEDLPFWLERFRQGAFSSFTNMGDAERKALCLYWGQLGSKPCSRRAVGRALELNDYQVKKLLAAGLKRFCSPWASLLPLNHYFPDRCYTPRPEEELVELTASFFLEHEEEQRQNAQRLRQLMDEVLREEEREVSWSPVF